MKRKKVREVVASLREYFKKRLCRHPPERLVPKAQSQVIVSDGFSAKRRRELEKQAQIVQDWINNNP